MVIHLVGRLVVQRALDDHADVVDHFLLGDVVQERAQRAAGLRPRELEVVRELFVAPLPDDDYDYYY